jgi:hypothetical protein
MSGILIPGQENKPSSDVKIELPGGFSSRRKGEDQKVAAAPAEAAAPAPDATAQPKRASTKSPGNRGQAADFLFPPTPVQIRCPNCGATYPVPLFSIIDLGVNPELKMALLGGQINVASCPSCGAGGPLGAPLLIHDPDHQFLGVFVPPGQGSSLDVQQQKAIGDLTQMLMRKLPQEARKGYLLQPRQFMDWNRLMEQLWEFEGVTPEMLRRQRSQGELLQRLMALSNDRKALELALQQNRNADLVDRDFFAMLDRLIVLSGAQRQNNEPLLQLRNQLLELTEAGRQVKARQDKVRTILQGLGANTTREELLETLLRVWRDEDSREAAGAVAMALAPLLDYQFLMLVSERLESSRGETERKQLEELRQLIVSIQEQQAQTQQAMVQQVQQVLQAVLQATDTAAALREYADYIDEAFLSVLAANIQAARRNNSTGAAKRLQSVYDQAVAMLQENMPAEMRLVNDLLSAPDKATLSRLLQQNRDKINKEFVASLKMLETDMRDAGRNDVADRIKSLRAQISLML